MGKFSGDLWQLPEVQPLGVELGGCLQNVLQDKLHGEVCVSVCVTLFVCGGGGGGGGCTMSDRSNILTAVLLHCICHCSHNADLYGTDKWLVTDLIGWK